jgi:6-phosphogluconate dehydrogenase
MCVLIYVYVHIIYTVYIRNHSTGWMVRKNGIENANCLITIGDIYIIMQVLKKINYELIMNIFHINNTQQMNRQNKKTTQTILM